MRRVFNSPYFAVAMGVIPTVAAIGIIWPVNDQISGLRNILVHTFVAGACLLLMWGWVWWDRRPPRCARCRTRCVRSAWRHPDTGRAQPFCVECHVFRNDFGE